MYDNDFDYCGSHHELNVDYDDFHDFHDDDYCGSHHEVDGVFAEVL